MDREVRIAPRETCDFGLEMERYTQPFGDRVILELKFNNRFPDWFNEMVQLFRLTRGAAAKYCEGMAALRYPQLGNANGRVIRSPVVSIPESDGGTQSVSGPANAGLTFRADTRLTPA